MPATITFFFKEYGTNKEGSTSIDFPSSITKVTAGELAIAFADLMGKFTLGRIDRANVSFDINLGVDSDYSVADTLSDLRDKARFAFNATGAEGLFAKLMTIPTYDESFTLTGDDKPIDTSDAIIDAFVDAMLNGIAVTAGTIEPVDSRAYNIFELEYARELS